MKFYRYVLDVCLFFLPKFPLKKDQEYVYDQKVKGASLEPETAVRGSSLYELWSLKKDSFHGDPGILAKRGRNHPWWVYLFLADAANQ